RRLVRRVLRQNKRRNRTMRASVISTISRRQFLTGAAAIAVGAGGLPAPAFSQARSGTLKVGILGLDTSDPHRHTGSIGVQQVFVEALTSIARDGSVEPWLAENIETSDDGLVYTFRLRPNVTFHN